MSALLAIPYEYLRHLVTVPITINGSLIGDEFLRCYPVTFDVGGERLIFTV